MQEAAINSEVLIVQICLPPKTHKSLWAQKVQFRCCARQYKYYPSTSIVSPKFPPATASGYGESLPQQNEIQDSMNPVKGIT